MKPINSKEQGCTPISSNCVIWQGPDLLCLGLCSGDTVSDVIFKAATQLCAILKALDISTYDLSCFVNPKCPPVDFHALVQFLITQICALQGIPAVTASGTKGCPDCTVTIATCFQFRNPTNGDLVTTLLLADYVKLIGIQVCALLQTLTTQGLAITNIDGRVRVLESKPPPVFNLPNLIPVCVLPPLPTSLDLIFAALEQQFCQLQAAAGTPPQIFNAAGSQPQGLNQKSALGTGRGTYGETVGWALTVKNLSDSFNNMWLVITDLMSAITNIQLNCCATPCNGVAVKLSAALPSASTLNLFFTGTIPASLKECNQAGTMFTIADQSGNSINVTIPLIANINNPSGFPVSLNGTPIAATDDLTISSTMCFNDLTKGTVCQSVLTFTLINTLNCPSVNYISGLTTLNFSFNHSIRIVTYSIQLFDSIGSTMLQNQTFPVNNPQVVSGIFAGLAMGTNYKVRVTILKQNGQTTTCPLSGITTLPNPCPPPQTVVAVISIP